MCGQHPRDVLPKDVGGAGDVVAVHTEVLCHPAFSECRWDKPVPLGLPLWLGTQIGIMG